MSCQQASRFITNNCNNLHNNNNSNNNINISSNIIKAKRITRVVNQEDPYVFTESVPTTPPILFNTQKTRTRLNDITSTTTTTLSAGKLLQQQQLPLIETTTNGKLAESTNVIKTQASLVVTSTTTTTPTIKSVTQSLTTAAQAQLHSEKTTTTTTNNNKKLTNVCIVRPQLQQQQPHHHQHHLHHSYHQQQQHSISSSYGDDLKSISPPPLYTPPTPSLWQTPLLLETTAAVSATPPLAQQPTVITTQSDGSPNMACVTPTIQTVGSTTITTMNPSLSTTAMAKVAPIIIHNHPLMPTSMAMPMPAVSSASESSIQNVNQCLPPSKFHNHTLAQHIQKVECLKKSKKQQMLDTSCNDTKMKATTPSITSSPPYHHPSTKAVSLQSIDCTSPVKHSETEDLNEIPVNVIFRMALVPQQQQKNDLKNEQQQSCNHLKVTTPANNYATTSSSTSIPITHQPKINLNKKCSIPASKTTTTTAIATANLIAKQHKQINSSSIQQQLPQQQHHHNTTTKTNLKLSPLEDQEQQPHPQESIIQSIEPPMMKANEKTPLNTKPKYSTHTLQKSRKLNSTLANLNCDLPYNWQMGCSTTKGAVAIVKMSQHNLDLDITPLATAAGLPYCRQQYWLNSYEYGKSSTDLAAADKSIQHRAAIREERVALYKQQLRRQAMQLLSTRSLQKLPLQVARRRLLCVDRLLRKYQQNQTDEKQLPANVKRCCANGCEAHTLDMAAHCQQHIVHNAAQHVFLPCTAKFADNTQCRVPVFDITHDLPLCIEHARKRDAYNRFLYEQRPRKISAPTPITMNDSVETANDVVSAKGGAAGAFILKTQNYQQLQPQPQQQPHKQQNNLKQFQPINNNKNNNKRPLLVNQQSRKRKMNNGVGSTVVGNPVGRPQKRLKKSGETTTTTGTTQMPRLTSTNLKRKSSSTSLESIATSNSQHSTTSSTSQQHQHQPKQQQPKLYGLTTSTLNTLPATAATTTTSTTAKTSLPPPALAPLSGGGVMVGHQGLPQHLFSFGHDNHHPFNTINDKQHSFSMSASSTTPTELKDLISQFSFVQHKNNQQHQQQHHHHRGAVEATDLLNTNSNSNFTSSVMGSTTSLPDDFLTQDMLSICENSSASSADTGLGGLSDPELMLGGPEDDIPLGDTHLLEEHDLANVLNSLPEDAFKELFATVHQDESDEIERAIEQADKHLKTLQQTIGSELGDFLDFNDDMLMDSDMCNASTVSANSILDGSALFVGSGLCSTNTTTHGCTGGGLVQT